MKSRKKLKPLKSNNEDMLAAQSLQQYNKEIFDKSYYGILLKKMKPFKIKAV